MSQGSQESELHESFSRESLCVPRKVPVTLALALTLNITWGWMLSQNNCDESRRAHALFQESEAELNRLGYGFVTRTEGPAGIGAQQLSRTLEFDDPSGDRDYVAELTALGKYLESTSRLLTDYRSCGSELRRAGIDAEKLFLRLDADLQLVEERISLTLYDRDYARLLELAAELSRLQPLLDKAKVGLVDMGDGRYHHQVFISRTSKVRRSNSIIEYVRKVNCLVAEGLDLNDGEHVEYLEETFLGRVKTLRELLTNWGVQGIAERTACGGEG